MIVVLKQIHSQLKSPPTHSSCQHYFILRTDNYISVKARTVNRLHQTSDYTKRQVCFFCADYHVHPAIIVPLSFVQFCSRHQAQFSPEAQPTSSVAIAKMESTLVPIRHHRGHDDTPRGASAEPAQRRVTFSNAVHLRPFQLRRRDDLSAVEDWYNERPTGLEGGVGLSFKGDSQAFSQMPHAPVPRLSEKHPSVFHKTQVAHGLLCRSGRKSDGKIHEDILAPPPAGRGDQTAAPEPGKQASRDFVCMRCRQEVARAREVYRSWRSCYMCQPCLQTLTQSVVVGKCGEKSRT